MATPTIVTLRAGVSFTPPAAASFTRCESGLGRRIDVNSTYRDYNLQLSMYNAWRRYVLSGYKASLKPPHSQAIHPDVSKHCQGLALDSDDWTRAGFNAFMADHGWIRTAASDPTERHHFEYQAARDNHRSRPAGGIGTPITGADDLDANQNNVLLWANENADKARLAATDANINADKARQHSERGAELARQALETAGWANTNADLARQAAQAALAKLDKLLTGSTGGTVAINYAALAKAVNDDAAKRLAN